jgi:hypothetical protein
MRSDLSFVPIFVKNQRSEGKKFLKSGNFFQLPATYHALFAFYTGFFPMQYS